MLSKETNPAKKYKGTNKHKEMLADNLKRFFFFPLTFDLKGAQEGSNKIFLPINRSEMEDNDNPEGKKSGESLIHCWGGDKLAHAYYGQYCSPQQTKQCTSPAMSSETYSSRIVR